MASSASVSVMALASFWALASSFASASVLASASVWSSFSSAASAWASDLASAFAFDVGFGVDFVLRLFVYFSSTCLPLLVPVSIAAAGRADNLLVRHCSVFDCFSLPFVSSTIFLPAWGAFITTTSPRL